MTRKEVMRETSIAAYEALKSTNVLSNDRWRVYDVLFNHQEGMTGGEVDQALKDPNEVNPSFHKRLSELEKTWSRENRG